MTTLPGSARNGSLAVMRLYRNSGRGQRFRRRAGSRKRPECFERGRVSAPSVRSSRGANATPLANASVADLTLIDDESIMPTGGSDEIAIGGRARSDALADATKGAVGHAELYRAGVLATELEGGRFRSRLCAIKSRQRTDADPSRSETSRSGGEIAQPFAEHQGIAGTVGGGYVGQANGGTIAEDACVLVVSAVVDLAAVAGDAGVTGAAQEVSAFVEIEDAHE